MLLRRRLALMVTVVLVAVVPVTGSSATPSAGWCDDRSRLVILGDSGSTGYGSPDYPAGAETYQATHHGWSSIASRNLAAEPAWRTQTTVIAHAGAQAKDFAPGGRWPDTTGAVDRIAQIRPTLVLIVLGGNEFYLDKDPAQFAAEYNRLVADVKVAAPGATLVLVVEWELGARASATPVHAWHEYAAKMRDAAVANAAGLVDLRQYLGKPGTVSADGLYLPDNIHPNQFGQRVIGAAMWSFLVWAC